MQRISLIFIFMIFFCTCGYSDLNLDEAIRSAQEQLEQVKNKNKKIIEEINRQRKPLEIKLTELRNKIENLKQEQFRLSEEKEKLLEEEEELKNKYAQEIPQIQILEAEVKEAATTLESSLHNSLISAQFPDNYFKIKNLITQASPINEEYLNTVLATALFEIEQSGKIKKYKGEAFSQDGSCFAGEIIRFGKIAAAFKYTQNKNKKPELIYFSPTSRKLLISAVVNKNLKIMLAKFFEKKSQRDILPVPIDITGGVVLQQPKLARSIIETIQAGGIVMWPILAVGLLGFTIIIERIIRLEYISKNNRILIKKVMPLINEGNIQKAEDVCNQNKQVALGNIFLVALKNKYKPKEEIEEALRGAILVQLAQLEKSLPLVSVLGTIAPLLGLLGTVLGIINTFDVMTIYGAGDPRMMAGGISEALITTQFGLIIAIPIILLHNYLSNKVDKVIFEIERCANTLVELLAKK